jgi:signal transduction histidine kinase
MIDVLKKKLVLILTVVIIILNVLSMSVLLVYLHISSFAAAMPADIMLSYRNQFLKLVLFSMPGMLALSYIASRVLVAYALKPAADFCRFQENFLSNVAHELRSPLASLQGNLEVSLRRERPVGEYKEAIRISLKETRRMIDLLKNLHLLASSQTKPLDILHSQVALEGIVSDLINRYRAQIDLKNIALSIEHISDASCFCDKSLIKRALENLIDNAVKYTPDRGTIKITASKDSRAVYLTIENTAPDIQADEVKDLFEAFYRGKNAANKDIEGKGLGLYITRYILRSHKGDITVAVTPDNLFSVTLSLPLKTT